MLFPTWCVSRTQLHSHRMMIACRCIVRTLCSPNEDLEGGTKDELRISNEALFKGVSTLFGLRNLEQWIETPDFIFCSSFQNLRLGSSVATRHVANKKLRNFMLPKRRFWKAEPTFPNAFSKHFSTFCSPNMVLTPLKSASKTHSERLVRPSKIFVWEG